MLVKFDIILILFLNFSRPTGILYYEELLHYFRNDKYTNSIVDEITNLMGSGTNRQDFIGYNVLKLKKREEMIQQPFKICKKIYFLFI